MPQKGGVQDLAPRAVARAACVEDTAVQTDRAVVDEHFTLAGQAASQCELAVTSGPAPVQQSDTAPEGRARKLVGNS